MTVKEQKIRWRLILGGEADEVCGGLDAQNADRDAALEYLYGREGQGRNRRTGRGGKGSGGERGSLDPSQLTVPEWINAVHTLGNFLAFVGMTLTVAAQTVFERRPLRWRSGVDQTPR